MSTVDWTSFAASQVEIQGLPQCVESKKSRLLTICLQQHAHFMKNLTMKWLILKNAANSVPYAIGRVLHSNPENDVNRGNRCFTISAKDVKYLEEANLLDEVSLTALKRHPTESCE